MTEKEFDWDLPKAAREFHRCGRAFSYAFWQRYQGKVEEFLNWKKFVRGWQNYPKTSTEEAWTRQTQFLLTEIQPVMERLREITTRFDSDQWAGHIGLSARKTIEEQEIKKIKDQLKATWAQRPKKRK